MALPGLSLPGLGLASTPTPAYGGSTAPPTEQVARREELPAQSEWRFEAAFTQQYTVRVLHGHVELEITREAESEYAAQETEYAIEWLTCMGCPKLRGTTDRLMALECWWAHTAPVKTPLIYHYPYASPADRPAVYKALLTRIALGTMNKLEEEPAAKQSGIIIDAPGSLNDPKNGYDAIHHLISEFSLNLVISIGSERLYNDLNRRYGVNKSLDSGLTVLKLAKPGGAIERDASYMKQLRTRQIRQYFFGSSKESLSPHSHMIGFDDMTIYRAKPASGEVEKYGADDEDYDPSSSSAVVSTSATFEKISPSAAMTGSLIAIKFCPSNSEDYTVRDSAVVGYLYVADVDEPRKKVRFLAPHPQRWGDRALVWAQWPEAVADLVT
ncbi:Cleavage polyadenylation factor subunit clp1 [Elasticomyces elasticus]|nr:Cleavage polyadenylation factor subunit clp1 [Elasticomyces elasticus]